MPEAPVIPSLVSNAVTYLGLGGPEVIKILERSVRAPEAGEVRIAVKAAAVNPTDILSRTPGWGDASSRVVPGMDAAGVLVSSAIHEASDYPKPDANLLRAYPLA